MIEGALTSVAQKSQLVGLPASSTPRSPWSWEQAEPVTTVANIQERTCRRWERFIPASPESKNPATRNARMSQCGREDSAGWRSAYEHPFEARISMPVRLTKPNESVNLRLTSDPGVSTN